MIETINPHPTFNDIELQSFGRRPTTIHDIRGLLTLCRICIGNVLEIGAWYGKTTYELAVRYPEKTFYTVDWLENKLEHKIAEDKRAPRDDIGKYSTGLENVRLHYQHSKDFEYLNKTIGMVFIDGDHSYKGVKADTDKALNALSGKVGIICWHDSLNGMFGVPHYLKSEIDPRFERKIFKDSQLSYIEI